MDYHRGEPLRHVGDITAMAADRYEGKLAFEYQGDELTYRELEEQSNSLADSLVEHGVEPGDRVAIYIENSLQFPVSFFGVIKAGGVAVPLNHRMDTGNLTYILDDGEVELLIASPVFATTAEDLYGDTGVETIALPGGSEEHHADFDVWVEEGDEGFDRVERGYDETAIQCYTSGTTGDPKGVMTTHKNALTTAQSFSEINGADPEDTSLLVVLPLFHMFGLGAVLMTAVYQGGEIILKTFPVASQLLDAITEHEITSFAAVPAIYIEMVSEYEQNPDKYDVSSIDSLSSGAAPLAEDTRERIEEVFDTPLVEGWGMTETSPAGTAQSSRGVSKGAGCIGQPLPDLELKLVDPETRETRVSAEFLNPTRPVDTSEIDFDDEEQTTGEIAVRGPQIFKGYYKMPDKTDEVFDDDGWFYTDDIARFDEDRYLWMVDRADDMMLVGGENVYPAEIENELYSHPDVAEAAVVPAPHEVKGEAPVAFIVPEHDADPTEREIREFALERMPTYAHPRKVFFVDELPRSGTRKVQRYKLEEEVEEKIDGELESSEEI
ncbi:MAG: class I adenylate-forming enzyme family protein [Halobacteriales archaeon]|nr:class I adenylate-forming enzyme family protein [Halobacteriales archaeon]